MGVAKLTAEFAENAEIFHKKISAGSAFSAVNILYELIQLHSEIA